MEPVSSNRPPVASEPGVESPAGTITSGADETTRRPRGRPKGAAALRTAQTTGGSVRRSDLVSLPSEY